MKINTITYYQLSNYESYGPLDDSQLDKKFATRELAVEYAKINGKPNFSFSPKFCSDSNLSFYEKKIEKVMKPMTRTYPRRAVPKHTKMVEVEQEHVVETVNYNNYSKEYHSWLAYARNPYPIHPYLGFFEIKYGETSIKAEESCVIWEAPVLIRFVEAARLFTKECKEPGQPYSPEKEEIKTNPISDWMKLYKSGGTIYNELVHHVNLSGSSIWQHTEEVKVNKTVYISEYTFELIENLLD